MDGVAMTVPAENWNSNAEAPALTWAAPGFATTDIYAFSYTGKDPTVAGLGFAAVRDWNSWLKYAAADAVGRANPLANDITNIYTEISSQPGRFLNDLRHL